MSDSTDFPESEEREAIDSILLAHGRWSPEDGFTRVTRGFEVAFYTHFAKTLPRRPKPHLRSDDPPNASRGAGFGARDVGECLRRCGPARGPFMSRRTHQTAG
jgi:hypothetical protein